MQTACITGNTHAQPMGSACICKRNHGRLHLKRHSHHHRTHRYRQLPGKLTRSLAQPETQKQYRNTSLSANAVRSRNRSCVMNHRHRCLPIARNYSTQPKVMRCRQKPPHHTHCPRAPAPPAVLLLLYCSYLYCICARRFFAHAASFEPSSAGRSSP